MQDKLGCFPCIKRVMLFILVLMIPTLVNLVQGMKHNRYWNNVVAGDAPFRNLDHIVPKDNIFQRRYILLNDPKSSKEIVESLKFLHRNTNGGESVMVSAVVIFFACAIVHFVSFCLYRERFVYRRPYRLGTYIFYGTGAALCFLVAVGICVDTFTINWSRSRTQSIHSLLSKTNKSEEHRLYFSESKKDNSNINKTWITAKDMGDIADICYKDFPYTMKAFSDLHHVFPIPLITKIQGRFYHPHEFAALGFCQYFHFKLNSIILLIINGILCLLILLIGWTQLRGSVIQRVYTATQSLRFHDGTETEYATIED